MNPYSSKNTCHACGASNASTTFVSVTKDGEDTSYIRRTCVRCTHSWKELPLYRGQEVNQPEKVPVHTRETDKRVAEEILGLEICTKAEAVEISNATNAGKRFPFDTWYAGDLYIKDEVFAGSCGLERLPQFSLEFIEAWGIHKYIHDNWPFSQRIRYYDTLTIVTLERLSTKVAWPELLGFLEPLDICRAVLLANS